MNKKFIATLTIITGCLSSLLYISQNCGRLADNADLNTLDNFANGARLRLNHCSGEPGARANAGGLPLADRILFVGGIAQAVDEALAFEARVALSAIPESHQRLFRDLGGHILITDAAESICSEGAKKQNRSDIQDVSGCVMFVAKGQGHEQILKIIMPPVRSEIGHGVVQLMGSFMADVIPTLFPNRGSQIEQLKTQLSVAYISDLKSSKVFNLSALDLVVGKGDKDILATKDTATALQELAFDTTDAATRASRRSQLGSMVFMQSYDSYFCNTHASFAPQSLASIVSGEAPASNLTKIDNTREIMRSVFPATFAVFDQSNFILNELNAAGGLGLAENQQSSETAAGGFGLQGDTSQQTPWGAFWGSVSDNTGYTSYNNYLQQASQSANSGSIFGNTVDFAAQAIDKTSGYDQYSDAVARGAAESNSVSGAFANGLRNGYKETVYDPQAVQTNRDFNAATRGGSTTPAYDAVAISLGRVIGTTPAVEAVYGYDIDQDRTLEGDDRILRGAEATSKLAGNAALVAGMIPSLRNVRISNPYANPTMGAAADATTFEAVQKAGIPEKYQARVAESFGPGATFETVGASGKVVYRYVGGTSNRVGRYVTESLLKDPIRELALPKGNAVAGVYEQVLKPGTRIIRGPVSPQNANPNGLFGETATGSRATQFYIVDDPAAVVRASGRTPAKATIGAGTSDYDPDFSH